MKPTPLLALAALVGSASAETVHGTLVDAAGKPLAGVTMQGYAFQGSGRGGRHSSFRAITGANGAFTLADVPSLPTADVPVRLIGCLPDGRFVAVDLSTEGGKAVVREHGATLRFRATDLKGTPLPGATVRVATIQLPMDQGELRYSAAWNGRDLSRTTDAQGTATFEGLPPGAMIGWQAEAPGRAGRYGRVEPLKEDDTQTVALGRAGVLSGRVLREGKPVEGVTVMATVTVDHMGTRDQTKTDADGAYRFASVQPGHVSLALDLGPLGEEWTATGYDDLRVAEGGELNGLNFALDHGVLVQGRVLTTVGGKPVKGARVWASGPGDGRLDRTTDAEGRFSFRVAPGEWYVAIDEVDGRNLGQQVNLRTTVDAAHSPALELRVPDVALMAPVARLTGTVVGPDGKAAAGATVRSLSGNMKATTDARGRFAFDSPTAPGTVLIAEKDGAMSRQAVEVRDSSTVDLKLDGRTATVQGTLTDDAGKPLPGVEVTLGGRFGKGYLGGGATTTDAAGAYRFTGLFGGADGFYLWAKKPGYGAITIQPIRTEPGGTKTLPTTVMAVADGTIDGRVLEPDGKPAVGLSISCQVQGVTDVDTDAQGRFHLTGVPRGKHVLVVWRNRTGAGVADAATGQKDVTIRLNPPEKTLPGLVTGNHEGQSAPALAVAEWVQGRADLKGKVAIVDFWAVWCHPCVDALPQVEALAKRYASRGVAVLGIHAPGTPKEKVAAFVKAHGLTYANALDGADGTGIGATHRAFGPSGIPHVFLIDAKGRILVDSNDIEDVERALAKMFGKG